MGYGIYERNGRWCGYGVPATCDHPDCGASIDRGLYYLCGGDHDRGCGLFFCSAHLAPDDNGDELCQRCSEGKPPFDPTPDTQEWISHMMTDPSWQTWRDEHPAQVDALRREQDEPVSR